MAAACVVRRGRQMWTRALPTLRAVLWYLLGMRRAWGVGHMPHVVGRVEY